MYALASVIRDLAQSWRMVVHSEGSAPWVCQKPAKAQTRGLQFHMHAEPERAEGCATCEEAGKRQSFGNLHQR